MPGYSSVMRAWKKELAAAGIEYKEKATGRVFDFHSLRKCLATFLRMAGVDPAISMKLMRHSDIRSTMQTYNDDELHDLQVAVQTLASLSMVEATTTSSTSASPSGRRGLPFLRSLMPGATSADGTSPTGLDEPCQELARAGLWMQEVGG